MKMWRYEDMKMWKWQCMRSFIAYIKHLHISAFSYFHIFFLFLLPVITHAQSITSADSVVQLLAPLDQPLPAAKPGEWRYEHFESTQSLESFQKNFDLGCGQNTIKIYVLGKYSEEESSMLKEVQTFLELYYNINNIFFYHQPLKNIPQNAIIKTTGHKQLDTRYVNSLIYNPQEREAIASLAICNWDLNNDPTSNFVFGESDPLNKIGCCSMYRLKGEDYNLTLLRLIKTCIHEINHMLGMEHCKTNYCSMNGNNSLQEVDQHPAYLCSACAGKLSILNEFPSQENTMALIAFCKAKEWKVEELYYEKINQLSK